MNSHINPTMLTGSSCSCAGSSKPCKCGGAGGCGGGSACQVDTMVRPRFFAGQLLTEDDLQALGDYVLAKNRLHNRHLFGAGVVCGLEVLCDPCGGGHVAVRPGYALDCCGNDIVLDCRLSLDINAMVRELRRDQLGGYDCGDPCTDQQQKLDKVNNPVREYCLYVRYCEQESDPVSPYAVDEPCNAQSCEASRIREGIRFELRCPKSESPQPELMTSILHCFQDVIGLEAMSVDALSLSTLQQRVTDSTRVLARNSYENLRSRLLDLIDRSPHLVSCKLRDRVLAVPPPATGPTAVAGAVAVAEPATSAPLIEVFLEILKECICMAVNPPCAPCDDNGVLLACLKVQNCDVVEICNMNRHFVISPVALRYWASFGEWERLLAAWCCGEQILRAELPSRDVVPGQGTAYGPAPIAPPAPAGTVAPAGTAVPPAGITTPPSTGTVPSDPVLPEAAAANSLSAITLAIAEMQPVASPNADRFRRVSNAIAMLGGQTPRTAHADVSEIERKTIADAVALQVEAATKSKFEEMNKALDQVTALKVQVEKLSAQASLKQRPRRDPGVPNG